MNWVLVTLAATAALAGPVVAGVVAPGMLSGLAEKGLAVNHRHFEFNEDFLVDHEGEEYTVLVHDGDIYEMPLTLQVIMRGAVVPAPSDDVVRHAIAATLDKYNLPVLSWEVQRNGNDVTILGTLPAGVLANLHPAYHDRLAAYETDA